jgi:hypothetical protein
MTCPCKPWPEMRITCRVETTSLKPLAKLGLKPSAT